VRGQIEEPAFQLDRVRMPPSLYQSVRDDLVIYSPVEVSRSAFRRSNHAYAGVIDSKGTPYYFALDSRGISVREADVNDDRVWKTFERLSDEERGMALRQRRVAAAEEMTNVDRELSTPQFIVKGPVTEAVRQISKTHADASPRQHAKAANHHDKMFKETGSQEHRHLADAHRFAAHVKRGGGAAFISMRAGEDPVGAIFNTPAAGGVGHAKKVRFTKSEPHLVIKALPKKAKEEKVKKTPNRKASSKKAGAGGKTRYNYPNEKKNGMAGAGGKAQPLPLVVVQHDDSKNANPSELANQLGVSVRTLQRCAKKLGREGFAKFMRSHLKRFSAKHRLDPDYWGTLYGKLVPGVG
jgi:hypothetical protein